MQGGTNPNGLPTWVTIIVVLVLLGLLGSLGFRAEKAILVAATVPPAALEELVKYSSSEVYQRAVDNFRKFYGVPLYDKYEDMIAEHPPSRPPDEAPGGPDAILREAEGVAEAKRLLRAAIVTGQVRVALSTASPPPPATMAWTPMPKAIEAPKVLPPDEEEKPKVRWWRRWRRADD